MRFGITADVFHPIASLHYSIFYRVNDKSKYEEILGNKHKELESMLKRLQLSETRLRLREQMSRDENMVSGAVSRVEHDMLIAEKEGIEAQMRSIVEESEKKSAQINSLTSDVSNLTEIAAAAERGKLSMANKLEDILKKEENVSNRIQKGNEYNIRSIL